MKCLTPLPGNGEAVGLLSVSCRRAMARKKLLGLLPCTTTKKKDNSVSNSCLVRQLVIYHMYTTKQGEISRVQGPGRWMLPELSSPGCRASSTVDLVKGQGSLACNNTQRLRPNHRQWSSTHNTQELFSTHRRPSATKSNPQSQAMLSLRRKPFVACAATNPLAAAVQMKAVSNMALAV